MSSDSGTLTKAIVRERLARHDGRHDPRVLELTSTPWQRYQNAAVFIGLQFRDGLLHVLLTLRSATLRHHANTVVFPGGKVDDGDADNIDTALREADEEIGLGRGHVEVFSTFPPSIISPNYLTTPVVGFVSEAFCPKINADEVAEVFYLPLDRFLRKERHTESAFDTGITNMRYIIHKFTDEVKGQTMVTWGMTANWCCNLATIVFNRVEFRFWVDRPVSVDDPFEQNLESLRRRFLIEQSECGAKL